MSKLVVTIKEPTGRLFDSLQIDAETELDALTQHFVSHGARVRQLANVVSVHFMPENALSPDDMASIISAFRDTQTGTVKAEYDIIGQWLSAIGAIANLHRIEATDGNGIKVWLYSIGGWICSPVTDPADRTAMVELKQYILSKAGYLHGQKDIMYPIDENWLSVARLQFVGYVTDEADLRQWPADMFRNGYVFLSPTTAYLVVNERVVAYNRQVVAERDQLLADWTAAGNVAAPAPVLTPKAPAILEWGTPEAFSLVRPETPLYSSIEALRLHSLPPVAQVAVQQVLDNTDTVIVYVNGFPFHADLDSVLPAAVIASCEENFVLRDLDIGTLPTALFRTIYAQSLDTVFPSATVEPVMIVTPYIVAFMDELGILREFARETNGDQNAFIVDYYQQLVSMYPLVSAELAQCMLSAIEPAVTYTVESVGVYGEALRVTVTRDGVSYTEQGSVFPVNQLKVLAAWQQDMLHPEKVEVELQQRASFDIPVAEAAEPARGQTATLQVVDEMPTFAADRLSFDAPKLQLQGTLRAAKETLERAVPVKPQPVVDAAVNAESSVVVPVVDISGTRIYDAEFMFTSDAERDSALERGFLPLLSTRLGSKTFDNRLLATARIGTLPSLASDVMATLGLTSAVVYRRRD